MLSRVAAARGERSPIMSTVRFGPDFVWGAATSCYQIEGAATEDGRGPSIWDRFARLPGKVLNGDTGDVACDHYHRYRDDVRLMRELGLDAYRFSIAWPRVLPEGRGRANAAGLDFYDRLVDTLLEAGIAPWACLHHWDLPVALSDRGGWESRDIAGWFADYAHLMADRLADRARHWFTFNEPNVLAWLGHATGVHAPGIRSRDATLAAVHHINLSHGKAVEAIRDAAPAGTQIGVIASLQPIHPAREDEAHARAAETIDLFWNLAMVDPLLLGQYPEALAAMLGDRVQSGDLETIAAPLDLFGLNHYCRQYAVPDPDNPFGAGLTAPPDDRPVTDVGWRIDGSGLADQVARIVERYPKLPIYITENGAAFPDGPDAAGTVHDPDRIAFLDEYLDAVARARDAGADIRGYFVWSLMDNYEWELGYSKRFGIVYVDYRTQDRIPKSSYRFYQELIDRHRSG